MEDLTIKAGVRVTGRGATPNVGDGLPPDRSGDVLQALQGFGKLADKLLAPMVAKEKEAAFVGGMTEVMQGRTTEQIAAEQPGWSRLFGDNYAVQGARLQEASSAGTRFLTRIQGEMPELRKLSLESFSRHVAEGMERDLPTDPQAAVLAKQRILQDLPNLTSAWSRANVQWQQEDALVKHQSYLESEVQQFKSAEENRRLNPGTAEPVLDRAAAERFQAKMMNPQGVDPKIHSRLRDQAWVGAVGSKDGIGFYQYLDKSGLLETLDQKVQDQIVTQLDQTVRRALRPAYAQAAQQGLAQGWAAHERAAVSQPNPGAYLEAAARQMNEDFAAVTGLPQEFHSYVSPAKLESALRGVGIKQEQIAARRQREQERLEKIADAAAKKREKAELKRARNPTEEDQVALVEAQILGGGGPGVARANVDEDPRIQRQAKRVAVERLFGSMPLDNPRSADFGKNAQGRAAILTSMTSPGRTFPSQRILVDLLNPLSQPSTARELEGTLAVLGSLNEVTRAAILDSRGEKRYKALQEELSAVREVDAKTGQLRYREPLATVFERAVARSNTPSFVAPSKEADAVGQPAAKAAGLSGEQAEMYSAAVGRSWKSLTELPSAERVKQAPAFATAEVFPMGKWALVNRSPGQDMLEVVPNVRPHPAKAGAALDALLAERKVPSSAIVHFEKDSRGLARYSAHWTDGKGRPQWAGFTGQDLMNQLSAKESGVNNSSVGESYLNGIN